MGHRGAEVDHQIGVFDDVEHRLEEFHIGLEIAVGEVAHGVVVGGEDIDALVDGAVLDDGVLGLGDVEQVAKSLLEKVNLKGERPAGDVGVIVFEIGVVIDGFETRFPAVVTGEKVGERCLAATHISCDGDMHCFEELRSCGVKELGIFRDFFRDRACPTTWGRL